MSEEGVAYFYESVIRGRQLVCRNHAPQSVTEALPNRTYTLPSKATFSYSDLAVIGHVTAAEKGPAFAHAGEDVVVLVSFDDPSAAERTAHVHVTVEEFFGKEPVPAELVFQMGLLNADNPSLFLDGLRSLRPHRGGLNRPSAQTRADTRRAGRPHRANRRCRPPDVSRARTQGRDVPRWGHKRRRVPDGSRRTSPDRCTEGAAGPPLAPARTVPPCFGAR